MYLSFLLPAILVLVFVCNVSEVVLSLVLSKTERLYQQHVLRVARSGFNTKRRGQKQDLGILEYRGLQKVQEKIVIRYLNCL